MASGPSRFSSQPGTFFSIPGAGSGTKEAEESIPALPKEAAPFAPGSWRSISTVDTPRFCSSSAQHTPTIPAPITTTFSRDESLMIFRLVSKVGLSGSKGYRAKRPSNPQGSLVSFVIFGGGPSFARSGDRLMEARSEDPFSHDGGLSRILSEPFSMRAPTDANDRMASVEDGLFRSKRLSPAFRVFPKGWRVWIRCLSRVRTTLCRHLDRFRKNHGEVAIGRDIGSASLSMIGLFRSEVPGDARPDRGESRVVESEGCTESLAAIVFIEDLARPSADKETGKDEAKGVFGS